MLPIEVEIDKRMRKLYSLRRLINIGADVACRRVLFIRSARLKWNHKIKMTGFVTDIVDVLEKYELLHYLLEFVSTNFFSRKKKEVEKDRKRTYIWKT